MSLYVGRYLLDLVAADGEQPKVLQLSLSTRPTLHRHSDHTLFVKLHYSRSPVSVVAFLCQHVKYMEPTANTTIGNSRVLRHQFSVL